MRSFIISLAFLSLPIISFAANSDAVYQDPQSGLFWNKNLSYDMNYKKAVKACARLTTLDKEWRLPTIEEYEMARENDLKKHFNFDPLNTKKMYLPFWTSSVMPLYRDKKVIFNGFANESEYHEMVIDPNHNTASAVCVAE